jgi:putative ubiquitin-RnfH superfamily antitoxin RatB of RatAB toxin-antitoxin module
MKITLAFAGPPPSPQGEWEMQMPADATVADALGEAMRRGWLPADYPVAATGVWGKVRPAGHVLRDGDRVELYRALQADPKEARRKRAGQRTTRK